MGVCSSAVPFCWSYLLRDAGCEKKDLQKKLGMVKGENIENANDY
nr:hypothetical protein B11C_190051 [Bartonella sp. 1-1C]